MSEKHVQGINVQIFGEEYPISSEGDVDEVRRIASYVDQKMQEIAQKHSEHSVRLSTTRVAVLAAMEITVELFQAMQGCNQLTERAYENPKFVEDVVRDIGTDLFALFKSETIAWFYASSNNFESIHNHDAFAKIERGARGPLLSLRETAEVEALL